ncbi:myotubularin, putative [Entamoeba invadens IP1]|uniref:myotubularin, putative n=1 Tax=Entamoeba invadens IP1 TaxID=370355 RepID=UPI0002C3E1C7|nr:myotubularin, putative [Entamoeba invadens IP1]ELP85155.1 myotubularin, putative [Entamoeba invadens IP1]|eukprot:XP_004184501.1 myotubularin, putative [Entamoeba invadens IP1]
MFFYKPYEVIPVSNDTLADIQNEMFYLFCYDNISLSCYENIQIKTLYDLPNNQKVVIRSPTLLNRNKLVQKSVKREGQNITLFSNNLHLVLKMQLAENEYVVESAKSLDGALYITSQRFIHVSVKDKQQVVEDISLNAIFNQRYYNGVLSIGLNPFYNADLPDNLNIPLQRDEAINIGNGIKKLRIVNPKDKPEVRNYYLTQPFRAERKSLIDYDSDFFKIYTNTNYKLCATYPPSFVIPKPVADDTILKCAEFRSKGRLPMCMYNDSLTHTSLFRSAQPLVANLSYYKRVFADSESKEDQTYLDCMRTVGKSNDSILIILDCRPYTNAYANRVNGGGYENTNTYIKTDLQFLNMPNIHEVRNIYTNMRNALRDRKTLTPTQYFSKTSGWLELLYTLLISTKMAVGLIRSEVNVLVHCSDGWDRTAQMSALTRLVLEKKARTVKGFFDLIYQEWILAGHKFMTRLHLSNDENSPVFLQFIEVVVMLVKHRPSAFQFNEDFLIELAAEAVCPKTVTFLFDCDSDRNNANCQNYEDFFTIEEKNWEEIDCEKLEDVDLDICCNEFGVWERYYLRKTECIVIDSI